MNILMMTNTYAPIVGGLERSIQNFVAEYRKLGHRVLIAAPKFKRQPKNEKDVIRIPSIQNFNGTDFSVNLPIPEYVANRLKQAQPDIIHAHHPFLMGDMALRLAAQFSVPLVFTYHTLYEQYLKNWFHDPKRFQRFIISLTAGYANLADEVFAPTRSVYDLLRARGVVTPIEILPTGIYIETFQHGSRGAFRNKFRIPQGSFVMGYAGRLSSEKNLSYLVRCVIKFMKENPAAEFLLVGCGESEAEIKKIFETEGLLKRFHETGLLTSQALVDAYHAMDVFVFASKSETQGIVLLEALASGVPIIAITAPGTRDIVQDFKNGRLIQNENETLFSAVLKWFYDLSPERKRQLKDAAQATAIEYSMPQLAKRALGIYGKLLLRRRLGKAGVKKTRFWVSIRHRISAEWGLFKNVVRAAGTALISEVDSGKV